MGTIGHLDEEQSFMLYNLSAAYFLNPYFGIDLLWEQLEAKAVTETGEPSCRRGVPGTRTGPDDGGAHSAGIRAGSLCGGGPEFTVGGF